MIEDKLIELGLQLPIAPIPLASYVPAVVVDNLIFTSGQIPVLEGELKFKGKIGKDLTEEEGRSAAELCVLNCLSVIKNSAGSLDKIEKIIKVTVFINSADNFTGQPKVANGASDLLVKLFGEKGKHARSAVGVNELPINAAAEIEMIARLAG
ncbi:MAG: RidA family protein [Ignavibacteriales bacterium]|nr:RidA family protein [Ignavibacteriales bacterium]